MEAFFHCFDVLIKLTRDKNQTNQTIRQNKWNGRNGETGEIRVDSFPTRFPQQSQHTSGFSDRKVLVWNHVEAKWSLL